MTDLVGRSLGRYRIVELLGAGGMGEIYRARDGTLQRDVAIKVLSDAITGNPLAFQVTPVMKLVGALGFSLAGETVERIRDQATEVPPTLKRFILGVGMLSLAGGASELEAA